jgi:hypothetical protein
MMRLRLSFFGFLALIASCGAAPAASVDTPAVATRTRAELTEAPELPELVGFAGSRFPVLEATGSTIVFDAQASAAFTVAGHPVRTAASAIDVWADVGLTGNELESRVDASADGGRMLVRTETGIAAIDLMHRGAVVAELEGESEGASIASDGASFATWSATEMTLVRIADGERVAYPFVSTGYAEPSITWTPRTASWTDANGVTIVERATWRVTTIAMQAASLVASNDGAIVVAFRGALTGATRPEADSSSAVVEIWRAGDSNAPTRMVTPVATHPSEESAEPSFDGERSVRKFAKDQLAKRYGFDRDAEAGSRSSTIRLATS